MSLWIPDQMGGVRGQPLLSPACMPTTNPLYLPVDAGAPVYFYEFQHQPQCLKDRKPPYVKADHTDEIRFVFGGAFLKGNIVMFGKKLAWGVPALAGTWNRDKGRRRESPLLAWSLAHPSTMREHGRTGSVDCTSGLQTQPFPEEWPHS